MSRQPPYEPLDFEYDNVEEATKHINKQNPINPMKMIDNQQPTPTITEHQSIDYKGTFVNDYLLDNPDLTGKEKKIGKQDKRTFYKTKMCPDGRDCKRKFVCNFAHGENQLRKPFIKRKEVCVLYQKGKCQLGSVCRLYHGNMDLKKKNYKYKTQVCLKFLQGKCMNGNICIYIHEHPVKEQTIQEIKSQQEKPILQEGEQGIDNEEKNQIDTKQPEKVIKNTEIIEVIQEKVGAEQFVQDGFSFSFPFNFN